MLARDRSVDAATALHRYMEEIVELHHELRTAGLYGEGSLVTAGGSAFPDIVMEHLAPLADANTTIVIRSGCYLIHDDGFYATVSPLSDSCEGQSLRPAMHAWARTLSRPEPSLAFLDAGRRDVSFDAGLPIPQRLSTRDTIDAEVVALNDQHAFLAVPPGDTAISAGSVVRLGLSHPCTVFDKWKLIPMIDNADEPDPAIVDLIHTFF